MYVAIDPFVYRYNYISLHVDDMLKPKPLRGMYKSIRQYITVLDSETAQTMFCAPVITYSQVTTFFVILTCE